MNDYALVGVAFLAVVVAVAGVLLLSPEQGPPVPDRPGAERVIEQRFDPAELERADEYRSRARMIALAALLAQFTVLAVLALWRGNRMRRLLDRLGRRPLRGALMAGAGISALLSLVGLPLDLTAWQLGREYDLITQDLGSRLVDWLIATAVGVVPAAVGALVAMALWRWLKNRFWIAAAVLIAAWALVATWLWPVLVSPLFNDFEPLPEGPVRTEVLDLADRAGVEVGEVYVVDASRRSSTVNAYVNGIGSSKRVVFYDNALRDLDRDEFEALIGHELGHVAAGDLWRGLTFALLVIPLGALFVQLAAARILRRNGDDPRGPALVPVLALVVTATVFVLQIPGNALSRNVEARADRYALELTGNPDGLVALQAGLAEANLSDVDPPAAWHFVFGSHPATLDRIAIAEGAAR